MNYSTHVYHQYTLIVKNKKRDKLKTFLERNGIPSMVYYPLSLDKQNAFKSISKKITSLDNSAELSESVLSLPIHTELMFSQLDYIIKIIYDFYYNN